MTTGPAPDIRRITTHRADNIDTVLVEHWRSGSVSHLGLCVDNPEARHARLMLRAPRALHTDLSLHCEYVEYTSGRICYYRRATDEDRAAFARAYP